MAYFDKHSLQTSVCLFAFFFFFFFFLRSSEERKKKTISNPLFINQQTSCSSVLIVLCNINNDNIRFSKDFRSYVSNFHKTNFPSCKVPCSSHLIFSCFKDVFLSLINLCSSLHKKLKKSNRKAAWDYFEKKNAHTISGKLKLTRKISGGVRKKWKGTQILARLNQKKKYISFSEWTRPISK